MLSNKMSFIENNEELKKCKEIYKINKNKLYSNKNYCYKQTGISVKNFFDRIKWM